jgi:hypothetical protein
MGLCDFAGKETQLLDVALNPLLGQEQSSTEVIGLVLLASIERAADDAKFRVKRDSGRFVFEEKVCQLLHQSCLATTTRLATVDDDYRQARLWMTGGCSVESNSSCAVKRNFIVADEIAEMKHHCL